MIKSSENRSRVLSRESKRPVQNHNFAVSKSKDGHTDLSTNLFRDALSIRYGHTLRRLPVQYGVCETPNNLVNPCNERKETLPMHCCSKHIMARSLNRA